MTVSSNKSGEGFPVAIWLSKSWRKSLIASCASKNWCCFHVHSSTNLTSVRPQTTSSAAMCEQVKNDGLQVSCLFAVRPEDHNPFLETQCMLIQGSIFLLLSTFSTPPAAFLADECDHKG